MENLNIFLNYGNNSSTNQTNTTGCSDGVQWIYSLTGDCCVTAREQISAYLGIASIIFWGFVGVPQLCKNMCHIAGMVGLSIFLILQWVGGDLTNLIGCILTNQNNFQIILAIYFIVMDAFLVLQYLYYLCWKYQNKNTNIGNIQSSSKAIMCLMGFCILSTTFIHNHIGSTFVDVNDNYGSQLFDSHKTRTLLFIALDAPGEESAFWQNPRNIAGYCLGVVSALFYLGSRVSQIYKNVTAQSTAGLAFLTFTLAIFGNLTYGGQIIILDWSREYVLEKLPWLLGSFGVVFLDCFILLQFLYYKRDVQKKTEEQEALLTGEYLITADDTAMESESTDSS